MHDRAYVLSNNPSIQIFFGVPCGWFQLNRTIVFLGQITRALLIHGRITIISYNP